MNGILNSIAVLGPDSSTAATSKSANQPATAAQFMPRAREFESILLSQWLQGAETSFGSVPGSDEGQDAGDEQFKGFAVQQLAKSLSNSGGIGIAHMVAKALAHSASVDPTATTALKSIHK